MSVELSPANVAHLERCFSEPNRERARKLLEEQCADNLPFHENSGPGELERVRAAAIKVSEGDLPKLREAIRMAKLDWRDLLVAAEGRS